MDFATMADTAATTINGALTASGPVAITVIAGLAALTVIFSIFKKIRG